MHSSSSSSSSSSNDNDYEAMFSIVKEWDKSTDERRQTEEVIIRSFIPPISSTIHYLKLGEDTCTENAKKAITYYINNILLNTSYPEEMFRRRYRMRRHVFCRIMEALRAYDYYFHQNVDVDASGRLGISIEQKCTAAMRILAYGTAYDSVDEHLNVAETIAKECLLLFVVIIQFRNCYMRRPNADDIATLLRQREEHGFP